MDEKMPAEVTLDVAVVAVPGTKNEFFDKDTYKVYADTAPAYMKIY